MLEHRPLLYLAEAMGTLHIAPGHSAAASLREAIRNAGRDERVLLCPDDLSCGPIDPDSPSARAAWWASFHDAPDLEAEFKAFWDSLAATDDRLIVWFGRHSAHELAFFLAVADRLGDRPYDIVDVTDVRLPLIRPDGTASTASPAGIVAIIPTDRLSTLFGLARPITARERSEARSQWQRLRTKNAPFRIVTPIGLASVPADHFDPLLIEHATKEWRKLAYVIGATMAHNCEPYVQTGDLMLLARAVALVESGKLLAEGDPWNMRACRVRLPS